jgi:cardiolipin synthase
LHDERYFPKQEAKGNAAAQVFTSSPRQGADTMHLMYLMAIAAAQSSIYIATPYFLPDELVIGELLSARERGVSVKVLVPGPHIDSELARQASRSTWEQLLDAGTEIYEYQPTMLHAKLFVVDEAWASVGSSNFDPRSFRLNAEANLNIFDAEVARSLARVIRGDIAAAKRVSIDEWRARPWTARLSEWFAESIKAQL